MTGHDKALNILAVILGYNLYSGSHVNQLVYKTRGMSKEEDKCAFPPTTSLTPMLTLATSWCSSPRCLKS